MFEDETETKEQAIEGYVDHMVKALEQAKENLKTKFEKLHEELVYDSFNNFFDSIQDSFRYDFERLINDKVQEVIEDLLIGKVSWLKDKSILSCYTLGKLKKVRMAIWKEANEELTDCVINDLQTKINELKRQLSLGSGRI